MTMLAYLIYSALLTVALVLSAPWWLVRMVTTERYREGLKQRLGFVPPALLGYADGHKIVWLHAVSVGEVLAASRLIGELETALGDGWRVVISTTTRTGQTLAKERFGAERVFYMPLDFAFAVRAYMRALQPAALILMESELWPRLLYECKARNISVAVVNARISDRSYRRAWRVRAVWARVLRMPTLWLAQSEEDARRLRSLGVQPGSINSTGNLKYDIRAPHRSRIADLIRQATGGRPVIVAGSTVEGEDDLVLAAFDKVWSRIPRAFLVLAPRHPERFAGAVTAGENFGAVRASTLLDNESSVATILRQTSTAQGDVVRLESNTLVVVLDTIGDLASMYEIASVAFVGGSLVNIGGHNPLEPAQFGRPTIMGPSFQNFRAIVEAMKDAEAIHVLSSEEKGISRKAASASIDPDALCPLRDELAEAIIRLITLPDEANSMGERGRVVFEQQQGATARTVEALVKMITGASR